MGMENSGLSVADALALQNRNVDDGMFGGMVLGYFSCFSCLLGAVTASGVAEEMLTFRELLQEQTSAKI